VTEYRPVVKSGERNGGGEQRMAMRTLSGKKGGMDRRDATKNGDATTWIKKLVENRWVFMKTR
jgi:hypothetical protein